MVFFQGSSDGEVRGVTLRAGGTGSLSAWRTVRRCTPNVRAKSRIEGLSLPTWALRICSNNSTLVLLVMAQDFQPAGSTANLTDAGCQVGPNQVITVGPEQVITLSTLFGGLVTSVGASVAFYFSSKSAEQARQDVLSAAQVRVNVPNLRGKTITEAQAEMASIPLLLVINDPRARTSEIVVEQSPANGSSVRSGSQVVISTSSATAARE